MLRKDTLTFNSDISDKTALPILRREVLPAQKIVLSSDEEIKPLLTEAQVRKLEEMRKEQKQELKKRMAEKADPQN